MTDTLTRDAPRGAAPAATAPDATPPPTTAPPALDDFLDGVLAERVERAARHGHEYRRLWEAATEAVAGGKRIRPMLVLAAHRAWGDPRPDDAVRVAAAFELLHTAFLMHDDVIDHDLVRRGRPNVAGRFAHAAAARGLDSARAHDYGDASAILAGDLLISAAHGLVAGVDAPAPTRLALLDLVDECVFTTAAGEHDDVRFAAGVRPGRDEILAMIEAKTAAYSFSAPLRAGALLAEAGPGASDRLDRIGRSLGIAFQLRDDVLGVFGDERTTGKSTLGDLREGKETLLVASARGHADWEAVAGRFGDPRLDEAGAAALRDALVASGALAQVEALIDRHAAFARVGIDHPELPAALRDDLRALVAASTERRR
ncbi:polyprenyl synthetase family protein [Agromyces sp. MMS24-K17]|uniref:polyprenyl synthetase family protein n=1 Tax=Agromyces sp. MMS24-K17 TaxID=3372850 RepID=UPI0037548B78